MTASRSPTPSRLIPVHSVDPQQALPALEQQVLARWRERDVFRESLRMRADAPPWIFYEGPPTANGPPGAHHVLSRVFKDIYPRYKTMRGHLVERKGGWDCHGLPVEIAVEQELGITTKAEIEEQIGIARFNAKCRESVFAYVEEWNRLTERIGFWLDLDDAYRTLDESYIESVWWALAELHREGLLYEARKVVPYCPRCATALSSHEVALGYEDTTDPSIYVRLQAKLEPVPAGADDFTRESYLRQAYPLQEGDSLLIWTTTPWTLPGNVAVAVAPDATYVRARAGGTQADAEVLVLAEARVAAVLGEHAEILQRFPGRELAGKHYKAPIFTLTDRTEWAAPVLAASFVTTDDGTGLVHVAPAFGEDDFNVAAAAPEVPFDPRRSQTPYNPVRPDGTFDERVRSIDGRRSYEGRFVKDPELANELIEDLRANGQLLKAETYEHSYPHCWRCGTPLIYYAKASWYVRTTERRGGLLDANETVNWHPEHVKHGRFGEWLKGNVDWALSRERYWGTPLPIWRCPHGHVRVIGSFGELEMLSGRALADHHRPFVDDVEVPCPQCARRQPAMMRRVPEVIDVWFDSGAMPFAQYHAPFEHEAHFRARFPADFICEALDQTRGWFYSLLAISTLLFDEAPYRNVVCLGLILDARGQKMSKSKGNAVEPWDVIDSYGADAFRWYLFTSKAPWDGYRFSTDAIGEQVRLFLKRLWNTYYLYALYAHANADALRDADAGAGDAGAPSAEQLDRWVLSRTAATAPLVAERLDSYDATTAGRAITELLDDLSNWYVRRSRRRFWDGDADAFRTLRSALLILAKLLAPFCPFVADEIYDNLDGTLASVHLCDFPTGADLPARDSELEQAMATARQAVRLGLGARAKAKIRNRQPLAEAVVVAAGAERAAIELLADLVRDELNVKRVRFVHAAEELARYEVKPNYQRLGPLFGKDMPQVAEAIAALDPARVAASIKDGGEIGVTVAGRDHTLSAADVQLTMQAPEGFAIEREGTHAVALELAIDQGLRLEGRSRDIVHAVQNARRNAGLAVEDRIELSLEGDPELLDAAQAHGDYLAGETLAVALFLDGHSPPQAVMDHREQANIDGLSLGIALRRVPHPTPPTAESASSGS
jgi:isoleucyl-tRNA synthetase